MSNALANNIIVNFFKGSVTRDEATNNTIQMYEKLRITKYDYQRIMKILWGGTL